MSADIGIDLGTANVLVYLKNKGIVLDEPSVVAINEKTKDIVAIGKDARLMVGRSHNGIKVIRPLRGGVISDFTITEEMLKYFIKKVLRKTRLTKPRIAVCVPSRVTSVEKRAVEDATKQCGAKEVFIIEEPMAAAIGAGINVSEPYGNMIVDIGGGTTDVAVISLGGIVVSDSIKIAGDDFDDAIIRYIKKTHKLLIGERSAEYLKIKVGTVFKDGRNNFCEIKGRNTLNGLPSSIVVSEDDLFEPLVEVAEQIIQLIKQVFEKTPPELAGDILERGIVLSGGGGLLYGLGKLITQYTGINIFIPENSVSNVALGTGMYIENIEKYNFAGNVY